MFVTVGDAQLYAVAFGSPKAPAILGIGGWIGSWELWADPFSLPSERWRTLAFDIEAGYTGDDKVGVALQQFHPDYIVVGRPIRNAPDPRAAAEAIVKQIAQRGA